MTKEKFEVIIVPSFQKEIERIKEKKQLELIYKSIEKIERMGKNAIKLLHVRDKYILGEIKLMNPLTGFMLLLTRNMRSFTL
jgi:hypothetical protein